MLCLQIMKYVHEKDSSLEYFIGIHYLVLYRSLCIKTRIRRHADLNNKLDC